jgi:hypothetical protein
VGAPGGAGEGPSPEGATAFRGYAGRDLVAHPPGERCEVAEPRLERGLDGGPDLGGEDRRGALSADGDDEGIAVDDRRGEGVAEVGRVDDVVTTPAVCTSPASRASSAGSPVATKARAAYVNSAAVAALA